jgi:hypothetical protein
VPQRCAHTEIVGGRESNWYRETHSIEDTFIENVRWREGGKAAEKGKRVRKQERESQGATHSVENAFYRELIL